MEPGDLLIVSSRQNGRYKYRRILSQVCATVAQGLLMMDLGMMIVSSTVINGALLNAKEGFSLNDNQSSWFGSILLLCQPLGCILSGCLQGVLGRKWSMILVNVPMLASWYLMHTAWAPWMLYTASAAMGVGIGFLEAPTLAYIGEITEPDIRGVLATFVNSNFVLGSLLEFTIQYLSDTWRTTMLISCLVPLVTIVAIMLIPESPVWLLTKGRRDEALLSLRWLRGWVSAKEVSEEFHELELYCQKSKNELKTSMEVKGGNLSEYTSVPDIDFIMQSELSFIVKCRDLLRPEILKPLRLVIVYFFFSHAASMTAMRPFMMQVFKNLEGSIENLELKKLTVLATAFQGLGALVCIFLMRLVGKRALSLVSMSSCTICILSLSAYAFWDSFPSTVLRVLWCALFFSINLGIGPVPWLLISEVFPTRGRGVASSVCSAIYYGIAFLLSITWLHLETLVGLHGCFLLYGFLGVIGVVYVFFCVPETEGKSLAEIESYFTRKTTNNK